jgi:hypothetical protein
MLRSRKKDCREVIMSLLRKCQNAEQDTCFRIPTFLTTATITITFAAPTNKMLLIITVVLKVTWQGKRRQNFKIWRSKNWKKILCWAKSPCHDYVLVDLTRSLQFFLWKMGSSCKSYIRKKILIFTINIFNSQVYMIRQ